MKKDWTLTLWGFHSQYGHWAPLVHGYTEASVIGDLDEYPDESLELYSYFAISKYKEGWDRIDGDSPDRWRAHIYANVFIKNKKANSPLPLVII